MGQAHLSMENSGFLRFLCTAALQQQLCNSSFAQARVLPTAILEQLAAVGVIYQVFLPAVVAASTQ